MNKKHIVANSSRVGFCRWISRIIRIKAYGKCERYHEAAILHLSFLPHNPLDFVSQISPKMNYSSKRK